jgi:hypothetical protein
MKALVICLVLSIVVLGGALIHPILQPRASTGAREQVRDTIARELRDVRGPGAVDQYLMTLEARARGKGRVSALEVEPGIEAIRRLQAEIGPERTMQALTEFTQRMSRLSAELDGRDRSGVRRD